MDANPTFNPMLIQFGLIFLIFYFLILKPQRDKQRQHKEMVASLKKNDEVVTAGGAHGTIVNVKDATVVIRVDDNTKIEFDKEAVTALKKQEPNA